MYARFVVSSGITASLFILGVSAGPTTQPGALPYTARPVLDFEYRGQPAVHMPTGVAVGKDGAVFLVDGVNDRLVQFDAYGECLGEIRDVGGEALAHPINARVDSSGRLWIADTGHQRVLVRSADGDLARVLQVGRGGLARTPDITDLAPTPDGRRVWLVDNDNHCLILTEVESGAQTIIGAQGESLGQFQYPFMAALGRDGELIVTDVINGRAQVITSAGQPTGRIGSFGADLGEIYRASGVAVARDNTVWIADFVLGVVQVFTPLGELRDVLRGGDGKPFKFDGPMSLTFDADGNLYVTELHSNRVRKLAISVDPQAPLPAREKSPRTSLAASQARSCTICHIEWLEPFVEGRGTALAEPPANTPEEPAVSRAGTCLSCHNGSVVDSRRRVWQEHGHGTDIQPPPGMKVPPNLPLVRGRLACRTCHTAHATGVPTGDIKTSVFLRVPNTVSELCVSCHPDKTRGPELGTHPTGGMPWPVPQKIIDAGGKVGPNPRELTCQVCHTPHGAAHNHLLVLGTESNQLCLTCHEQMRPGMFREGAAEHPLSPLTSTAQAEAVKEMGTSLGPEGRLICLSCHKLHHGKSKRFMLADDLDQGNFCLRCHEERRVLLGSPHDLRSNFPEEKNRLGMTPESGGPCSACHMFHRYARAPEASEADPGGGKCITCHQEGRVAGAKALLPISHPKTRCNDCHNPHRPEFGHFLRAKPVDLCSRCHADKWELVGSKHDVAQSSKKWPAASVEAKDTCLACHRPHGTEETGLFRVPAREGVSCQDAGCLGCHQPGGVDLAAALPPINHPTARCGDCHNPHRPFFDHFLNGKPVDVCARCHEDKVKLVGGIHDVAQANGKWPEASVAAKDTCLACHRPHGTEETGLFRMPIPEGVSGPNTGCMTCHLEAAPTAGGKIALHHPQDATKLTVSTNLPLPVSDDGVRQIACRTCHDPHREKDSTRMLLRVPKDTPAAVLCTVCHTDMSHINMIGHGPEPLRSAGFNPDGCRPCHVLHAPPEALESRYMWPKTFEPPPEMQTAPTAIVDRHCVACHRSGGPVAPPAIATHPKADFFNATKPDEPGYLPLFNARGEVDPQGSHSCRTCHLTHGRATPALLPQDVRSIAPRELRARSWHLRSFGPGSVCTTCHGADALRRFMYFHDPVRRAGPISPTPG